MKADSFAVVVIIETPAGIPLVRDFKKPVPVFWKIPGGRSEIGETPEATAIREIQEEVGIKIDPRELKLIAKENRGDHIVVAFGLTLPETPEIKTGTEGKEEVRVFPLAEITKMSDFFPNHRRLINLVST